MKTFETRRKAIAFLFAALILVCIFAPFLPHTHADPGGSCTVCEMLERSRSFSTVPLLISAWLAFSIFAVFELSSYVLSARNETPVGLKVKLSD